MLSEHAVDLLRQAFTNLLGVPAPGHLVFTRNLTAEVCCNLAGSPGFDLLGWQVAAVVGQPDGTRQVRADQAVAWREDKGSPMLLLVDTDTAGAGMDGIYNAAREISEKDLFKEANALARDAVPGGGYKGFVDKALKRARRVAGQRHLPPLVEFIYLCRVGEDPLNAGLELGLLGLWPLQLRGKPDPEDLDRSARMAERLLPAHSHVKQTPEQRVEALCLPSAEAAAGQLLARRLREVDALPRAQALAELSRESGLRLGAVSPQMFDESALQKLNWIGWRGKPTKASKLGKPLAWSGLSETVDQRLEFRLLPEGEQAGQGRPALEVRWSAAPETLAKGAVEYEVTVVSDQDELASKSVVHNGKGQQKVVFGQDDFDLEEGATFQPIVKIRAKGVVELTCETEDFVLRFGHQEQPVKSSAGKVYPTMSLAAAALAPDENTFKILVREPESEAVFGVAGAYVTCHVGQKVGKVLNPRLLVDLGKDWVEQKGELGRWRVRVRSDGTPLAAPEFVPLVAGPEAARLQQAARAMAAWLGKSRGPAALIYHADATPALDEYALAAKAAWAQSDPSLTLMQTLEVVSQSGEPIGLVVLPLHPLRVAWQQSFDLLVVHHRYGVEEPQELSQIQQQLSRITGAHYPSFLPGIRAGEAYVFADTLGPQAVAMVRADDPEPKATVALLARLLAGDESIAPSVGEGAADALAAEVSRYVRLHPAYRRLKVHALRAGDAMAVVRGLGRAVRADDEAGRDAEVADAARPIPVPLAMELNLYPAQQGGSEWTGRHLSLTQERRRTGAGAVPEEDRWQLLSAARAGSVSLPRLRWARRTEVLPQAPAHLALAFDVFQTRVELRPRSSLSAKGALEAHGLMLMPTKVFQTSPSPHWLSYIPESPEGAKHPALKGIPTVRQLTLHATLLRSVVRHLGGTDEDWPVLYTEVSGQQVAAMKQLHDLCDWVVTADRNVGIEYFDSPQALENVYAAYIIDCAPERDELGFMQLVTSTTKLEEVQRLLVGGLAQMGLAPSNTACEFLLGLLKGVSGRLALRLAEPGYAVEELAALALVRHGCLSAEPGSIWPSLTEGFLIPLDDVPELFRVVGQPGRRHLRDQRADLMHVRAVPRQGLIFTFIEVKFRGRLDAATSDTLVTDMHDQVMASCRAWERLFGPATSSLEKTVQRAWLARILRFYANKGHRHGMAGAAHELIMREIDLMVIGKERELPGVKTLGRRAYVYCPEFQGHQPMALETPDGFQAWVFGAAGLPLDVVLATESVADSVQIEDVVADAVSACADSPGDVVDDIGRGAAAAAKGGAHQASGIYRPDNASQAEPPGVSDQGAPEASGPIQQVTTMPVTVREPASEGEVLLGRRRLGNLPVSWKTSIRGNPHLMILGLPGMGKTTCLINICQQLHSQSIAPIVFSYHEDIDEKLAGSLPELPLLVQVQQQGLGFNPMTVSQEGPYGYMDNVGMLRDIFAAIFPELGDVQLGRLRDALKQSYLEAGWGPHQTGQTPAFQRFFEILESEEKPDRNLLYRLSELSDYGFFDAVSGAPSLLNQGRPSIIQIHATQNEALQRAFATFVLYNLYQAMFQRGPQARITHAVIFDEAHRAARLKLIPTMVKECRKYGIAFVVASQEAKDFDPSVVNGVANYLALRLIDADAKLMAKRFVASDKVQDFTDRIKQLPKFEAMFYAEGLDRPCHLLLETPC